jgi:hypothetical protein
VTDLESVGGEDWASAATDHLHDDGRPATPDVSTLPPHYPGVAAFVEQEFAPIFARRITPNFRWCARWFDHPEARHRFIALWRAWETLRLDPLLGMGTWYEHHLDRHLPILTGNDGPFAGCSATSHYAPEHVALPTAPAPDWLDTTT